MPLPPYKKTKDWEEVDEGIVEGVQVDRSASPKQHRSIGKLQVHRRTKRTGSKPDRGFPGRPEGWE